MSWGDELVIIRRFLRDPDGNIWSEQVLRHMWNDVQQDFQQKTLALEDATAQRVPGLYHASYLYDWEWRFLSTNESQFYQCLNLHDGDAFCHRWEPQEITGIDSDVSDYGVHFTHPWEAFMGQIAADPVKMRWPKNLGEVKYIAYDEWEISATDKKRVQSVDSSYITSEGTPTAYYPYDETDNSYVLYPKPSAAWVNEIEGEGLALYAEDDTEDLNTGIIAVRTGSFDGEGAPLDIVDVTNSVFLVYRVSPSDMNTVSDEPDFPRFMRKYIRSGVISRAYSANTDGRIRSLGEMWNQRYELGIRFVKRYLLNRRADRNYRLTTKDTVSRRMVRRPRLPDTYPAV